MSNYPSQPDPIVSSYPSRAEPASVMSAEAESEQPFDIREYVTILMKYKWGVLGLAFVFMLVSLFLAQSKIPLYQSTTTLLIEGYKPNAASLQDPYSYYLSNQNFYGTQNEILRSRKLAEKVAERLNQDEKLTSESKRFGMQPAFDLKDYLPAAWFPDLEPTIETTSDTAMISAGEILDSLMIESVKDSQLVRISYISSVPDLAAIVPNTLAEIYIDSDLESRLEMTQKASSWLMERMDTLRQRMEESEKELQAFREKQQLVDVEGVSTLAANQLEDLGTRLIQARQYRTEKENAYNQAKLLQQKSMGQILTSPAVAKNELIAELRATELDAEKLVDELSKRYGPEHPKMINAENALNAARSNLKNQLKQVISSIEKEYLAAVQNERAVDKAYQLAKGDVTKINRVEYQLGVLEREVAANRQLYDLFLTRLKETKVSDDLQSAVGRIVDAALVPSYPFSPNKRKMVLTALLLGLFVGAGLAILYDKLDSTFKTVDEVEGRLGLPILGALPRLKLKKNVNPEYVRRLFIDEPSSPFSEAIRTLRTGVLLSALDEQDHIVLVTSTMPGEGKTTVALNLAFALGQIERVLIIDADMRRPSLAKVVGLDRDAPGLSNFVSGTAELKECIHKVYETNVDIMTAGIIPPNPLELLSSKRFHLALGTLAEHYDRIVIDSAPLYAVSDSMVLSKLVSALVYVVKMDSTQVSAVLQGVKRLRQVDAPLIGVTINQFDSGARSKYYSKYHYYGYYAEEGYQQKKS